MATLDAAKEVAAPIFIFYNWQQLLFFACRLPKRHCKASLCSSYDNIAVAFVRIIFCFTNDYSLMFLHYLPPEKKGWIGHPQNFQTVPSYFTIALRVSNRSMKNVFAGQCGTGNGWWSALLIFRTVVGLFALNWYRNFFPDQDERQI